MICAPQEPFALAMRPSRQYHAPQARIVVVQAQPIAQYVSQDTNAQTQTELELRSAAQVPFPVLVPRCAVAAHLASTVLLVHVNVKCAHSAMNAAHHLSRRKLARLVFLAPVVQLAALHVARALDAPLGRTMRHHQGLHVH